MLDFFLNPALVIILSAAKAEYHCVCNYNVEQSVLPYANAQAQPIGYVYEFDCKPTYPITNLDKENWYTIIYNGQVAYLQKNSNAEEMECAGQPEDRITTKMSPIILTYSTIPASKLSEKDPTNTTRQLNTTYINGLFSYPTNILPQRTTKSHVLSWSYSTTIVTETAVKTSALPASTNSQTEKMTSSTKYKDGTPAIDSGTNGLFTKYTTTKTDIYSARTAQAFSNLTTADPKNLSLVTYRFSTPSLSPSSKAAHSSVGQNTTRPNYTTKTLPRIITRYIPSTNIGAVNSIISTSQTSKAFTTSRSKQTTGSIKPGQTSSAQTPRTVTTDYRSLTENSLHTTVATTQSLNPPSSIGDISLCGQKLFQYTREDNGALTQYGGKCYELVPFELIWTKAELDCQAKGGHLLTVHSNLFQEFIYKWVKRFSGIPAVWLGLSNKQQDGIYQWISGESLRTKSWYAASFQSHRNNSEECGLMMFSPPYFGQWETVDCGETTPTGDRGSQNAFICEFHIESLITSGQIIGK